MVARKAGRGGRRVYLQNLIFLELILSSITHRDQFRKIMHLIWYVSLLPFPQTFCPSHDELSCRPYHTSRGDFPVLSQTDSSDYNLVILRYRSNFMLAETDIITDTH